MTVSEAKENTVLWSLPKGDRQRLLKNVEEVDLKLGQVLYEADAVQSYVYFPTTAIVSMLYVLENGESAELAVVGRDGLVGISLFMGGGATPSRAVVQGAGRALRLTAMAIQREFTIGGTVMRVLLRYTQALITQMAQTAVCNRLHTLDQQFCRWLLLSLDRLHGNEIVMTHQLIANMLGVNREGVTVAAIKLQKAGVIRYRRGHIFVLDRPALERRVCECYSVVKEECGRLFPPANPEAA